MKQLLMRVSCLLMLLSFLGCQGSNRTEVTVAGGGAFPESFAGRWKADKGGWEIVFGRDGTISSAVISFGRREVRPGRTTTMPLKRGGEGFLEADVWTVDYEPVSKELAVEIKIKAYRMEMGGNIIRGKLKDLLIGWVSEDGKSWQTEWFSFGDYIVTTPDSEYKDYKLPITEGSEVRGAVLFTKTDEDR